MKVTKTRIKRERPRSKRKKGGYSNYTKISQASLLFSLNTAVNREESK